MNIARTVNSARASLVRSVLVLGLLSAAVVGLAPARVAFADSAIAHDETVDQQSGRLVAMVELDRSGGIIGASDHFTVSAGTSHPETRTLMRTAGGQEFRALRDTYVDGDACCDRYRYVVRVHYRNHVTKTVTAMDGTPGMPDVLREVIDLTVQIGHGR